MDRQRGLGLTPSQPRLQGLGGGLGAGAVTNRQPTSHLKTGVSSSLPGASLRPGSLGSGSRLGSAAIGGFGAALPLRSVGRPSIDANCSPSAATAAAATDAVAATYAVGGFATPISAEPNSQEPIEARLCVRGLEGQNDGTANGPPRSGTRGSDGRNGFPNGHAAALKPNMAQATPAPTAQPMLGQAGAQDPGTFHRLSELSSDGSGARNAFFDGKAQLQPRRRESAPAAGLLGLSAPSPGGALSRSGGVSAGLPLRSILSGGGRPPTVSPSGDANNKTPQPAQVKIQWLPPAPGKAAEPATAPKPTKTKRRHPKQVQWLLPEEKQQKEQQPEQQTEQPGDAVDAMREGPPAKRPRLESITVAASAVGGPQRLGRLHQPVLSPVPATPPLQALAQNVTAGLRVGGPWNRGSEQLLLNRAGGKGNTRAGGDMPLNERPVSQPPETIPALTTVTAAQWDQLQRSLEDRQEGSNPARVAAVLRALLVYSVTEPPPPEQQQQLPSGPQQQRQEQEQAQALERSQKHHQDVQNPDASVGTAPAVAVPAGPCDAAPAPGVAESATKPESGDSSRPWWAPRGSSGTALRHGWYYPGPEAGGTGESTGAGSALGSGRACVRGFTDRTERGAPVDVQGAVWPHANAVVVTGEPAAPAAAAPATTYCDLQAVLRAHPGIVRALWQLVAAALGPSAAAGGDDGSSNVDGASAPAQWQPRQPSPPAAPPTGTEVKPPPPLPACGTAAAKTAGNDRQMLEARAPPAGEGGGGAGCGARQGELENLQQQQLGWTAAGVSQRSVDAMEEVGAGVAASGGGGAGAGAVRGQPAPRTCSPPPPVMRGVWASCAANVLRNLAVAELVPEQLLCSAGLVVCGSAMDEAAICSGAEQQVDEVAASLLELLSALPHRLRLPAPRHTGGTPDAVAVILIAPGEDPGARPSPPPAPPPAAASRGATDVAGNAPPPPQQQPAAAVSGALTAAAVVDGGRGPCGMQGPAPVGEADADPVLLGSDSAGTGPRSDPGKPRSQHPGDGGCKHKQGEDFLKRQGLPDASQGQKCDAAPGLCAEPVKARPTGQAAGLKEPPPLLEGVVRVLAAGPNVALRLRTLAAGLLAAWLGVPANQHAVLTALSSAPLLPPPTPPPPPPCVVWGKEAWQLTAAACAGTAAPEAGPVHRSPGMWPDAPKAPHADRPPHPQHCPVASEGRSTPLGALGELLVLEKAVAKAAAQREAAAVAAEGAAAAGQSGRSAAPRKDLVWLLAAWRRSDAIAAAVEVLHALATGCGPTGRRLLAEHPDVLQGLARLAAAAAERSLGGAPPGAGATAVGQVPSAPPLGPAAAAHGDAVTMRCRATLVAAANVAAEILAALSADGVTWAPESAPSPVSAPAQSVPMDCT